MGGLFCTHGTDTIAVLLIPDTFLIATLFIHEDRICVLTLLALHSFSRGSGFCTASEKRVL